MRRFIAILVSIVIILVIISLLWSFISYQVVMKRVESDRKAQEAQYQANLNPTANIIKEAEKNISITVNDSFKFKDNILIEVTLNNTSPKETAYVLTQKLKDENMLQCDELTQPTYVDFPLTEVQSKSFLSLKYSSTLSAGEGLKGYYCYRCPDPKINDYNFFIMGKKIKINPHPIVPGLNLDVVVNEYARRNNLVLLDITIHNASNENSSYSSELFTFNEIKATACPEDDARNVYMQPFPLSQLTQKDKIENKYKALAPGASQRGYLAFSCAHPNANDYVLTIAPNDKKIDVRLPQTIAGEIISVDAKNNTFILKYSNSVTAEEKEMNFYVDEKTTYKNVISLAEIKSKDSLNIDTLVDQQGNNYAKNISLERSYLQLRENNIIQDIPSDKI